MIQSPAQSQGFFLKMKNLNRKWMVAGWRRLNAKWLTAHSISHLTITQVRNWQKFGFLRLSGLFSSVLMMQNNKASSLFYEDLARYSEAYIWRTECVTDIKIFKDKLQNETLFALESAHRSDQWNRKKNFCKKVRKAIEKSLKVNFVNWAAIGQPNTSES